MRCGGGGGGQRIWRSSALRLPPHPPTPPTHTHTHTPLTSARPRGEARIAWTADDSWHSVSQWARAAALVVGAAGGVRRVQRRREQGGGGLVGDCHAQRGRVPRWPSPTLHFHSSPHRSQPPSLPAGTGAADARRRALPQTPGWSARGEWAEGWCVHVHCSARHPELGGAGLPPPHPPPPHRHTHPARRTGGRKGSSERSGAASAWRSILRLPTMGFITPSVGCHTSCCSEGGVPPLLKSAGDASPCAAAATAAAWPRLLPPPSPPPATGVGCVPRPLPPPAAPPNAANCGAAAAAPLAAVAATISGGTGPACSRAAARGCSGVGAAGCSGPPSPSPHSPSAASPPPRLPLRLRLMLPPSAVPTPPCCCCASWARASHAGWSGSAAGCGRSAPQNGCAHSSSQLVRRGGRVGQGGGGVGGHPQICSRCTPCSCCCCCCCCTTQHPRLLRAPAATHGVALQQPAQQVAQLGGEAWGHRVVGGRGCGVWSDARCRCHHAHVTPHTHLAARAPARPQSSAPALRVWLLQRGGAHMPPQTAARPGPTDLRRWCGGQGRAAARGQGRAAGPAGRRMVGRRRREGGLGAGGQCTPCAPSDPPSRPAAAGAPWG